MSSISVSSGPTICLFHQSLQLCSVFVRSLCAHVCDPCSVLRKLIFSFPYLFSNHLVSSLCKPIQEEKKTEGSSVSCTCIGSYGGRWHCLNLHCLVATILHEIYAEARKIMTDSKLYFSVIWV